MLSIYIETISFIHFATNFSFLKQNLKILASFLSVEDDTDDMWNKPTWNR